MDQSSKLKLTVAALLALLLAGGVAYYALTAGEKPATELAGAASAAPLSPAASVPAASLPAASAPAAAAKPRIKVGVFESYETAYTTDILGGGMKLGDRMQVLVVPRLNAPDMELYPIVEPDTAEKEPFASVLSQNFPGMKPILATDAEALGGLDVIVAHASWDTTPEIVEALTKAIRDHGVGFMNESGFGMMSDGRGSMPLAALAGLETAQFAKNDSDKVESKVQVIGTHPLLGTLSGKTDFTFTLLPNGVCGKLAPGTIPLIKVVDNQDVHISGDSVAFYPLLVSELGKGRIIGYNVHPWRSLLPDLDGANNNEFYIRCVRWLARRPLELAP